MPAPAVFDRTSLVGTLLVYAALTLGVCGLSRAVTCARAPDAVAATITPELQAFLGPVSPGMSLQSWTVAHVDAPGAGGLTVALRPAAGPELVFTVTRPVPGGPRPLAATRHFVIFFSGHVPSGSQTPPDVLAAAAALATALSAREAVAAPPPGL